jgi:hypothetical protein
VGSSHFITANLDAIQRPDGPSNHTCEDFRRPRPGSASPSLQPTGDPGLAFVAYGSAELTLRNNRGPLCVNERRPSLRLSYSFEKTGRIIDQGSPSSDA